MSDWIPNYIKYGEAEVWCKTCETNAKYNGKNKVYECDCKNGATVEALAFGLPGYTCYYQGDNE